MSLCATSTKGGKSESREGEQVSGRDARQKPAYEDYLPQAHHLGWITQDPVTPILRNRVTG